MPGMNRIAALMLLSTLVAGCQSIGANKEKDSVVAIRCWHYRDQQPISREQLDYIRDRSDDGNLTCRALLGTLYERGQGVPQDGAKAKALYLSVAQVYAEAYYHLGRLEEQGIGAPADYFKARDFYQRAANAGNSDSKTKLARLMEDGKGGPRDPQGALLLYFSALDHSWGDAWDAIARLRDDGLTLSPEQENRYNEVWVNTATARLKRNIRITQITVLQRFKLAPGLRPIMIKVEFNPGSEVPVLSLLEGCGDSAIDQAVLQAMGSYRFSGQPIPSEALKDWNLVAVISPRSR